MSAYSQYHSGSNSRRSVVFFAIIGLHLLIGWAFVSGFGKQIVLAVVKDVKVSLIKEQQVKETPPPPPKPVLDRPPPVSVPPPLINISVPMDAPAIVTTDKPPPPPPPRAVTVVPGTPLRTISRPECGEDYYPSQAKRLEQEGNVIVEYCVGATNKIESVKVVESSGFPLLDEAAGKCLAAGRYKAATQEGKPVASCTKARVKYQLKQGN